MAASMMPGKDNRSYPGSMMLSDATTRMAALALTVCMAFLVSSGLLHASESGPRAYRNVPVGINLFELVYVNSETTGSLNLNTDAVVLRNIYYFDFFGKIAALGGALPFANTRLSIPAFGLNKSISGMADPILIFGVDLYGAPALGMDDYLNWKQETIIGLSMQISAPLGQYDKTSILNLGSNRWTFKPEFAISHQIGDSGLFIETYLNYHFFTKNREYLSNLVRDQNGKWGIDSHLVYEFMQGAYASFDYFYARGGETTVSGILQGDKVDDTTIGASIKIAFTRHTGAELKYRHTIDTGNGNTSRVMSVELRYIW